MTIDEIKSLKDKGVKFLKDLFTPEEILALNAQVAPPVIPPVNLAPEAKEMKTKEGVSIFVVTDESGNMLAYSDVAATTPMADGEYLLEDGSMLVVQAGVAVAKAAASEPEPNPMAEMQTKLSAQEKSFNVLLSEQKKSFEVEISKLVEANKVLASSITKILDTPIYTANLSSTKKYEDMTPAEKYNHDHPIN